MNVYFYSTDRAICKKLASRLEREGHVCQSFSDGSAIRAALSNLMNPPDLLVIDYLSYNHDAYNAYREMRETEKWTPLIFYNDPIPCDSLRVEHWRMSLRIYYPADFIDIDSYDNALESLAEAVSALRVFIPLLRPPVKMPRDAREEYEKLAWNLPPAQRALFKIFREADNGKVSVSDLLAVVPNRSTLYSTISRLRESLKENFSLTNSRSHYILSERRLP